MANTIGKLQQEVEVGHVLETLIHIIRDSLGITPIHHFNSFLDASGSTALASALMADMLTAITSSSPHLITNNTTSVALTMQPPSESCTSKVAHQTLLTHVIACFACPLQS